MERIVIYSSKTGFTKQYATWIAEELGCDAVRVDKITVDKIKSFKTIIYGGGITAGKIGGLEKFKKIISSDTDKHLIVFATGATPAEQKENIEGIKNVNFTQEEREHIPFFYFQSGICYEKMKLGGKLILKFLRFMISRKKERTEEDENMLQMLLKSTDVTDKKWIAPLIHHVRSIA